MTFFCIELLPTAGCDRHLNDTDGYTLSVYILGLQIEIGVTVRNPFK